VIPFTSAMSSQSAFIWSGNRTIEGFVVRSFFIRLDCKALLYILVNKKLAGKCYFALQVTNAEGSRS
jgi:hypothetical protein